MCWESEAGVTISYSTNGVQKELRGHLSGYLGKELSRYRE